MPLVPVPIGFQSWPEKEPITAERLVNAYAEQAPINSKSPVFVRGSPGFTAHTTMNGSGCRGVEEFQGDAYFVQGTTLNKVESDKTVTNIGTIAGSGPVVMRSSKLHLVICNSAGTAYSYDATTLSTISDADFDGAVWCEYIDGYWLYGADDTDKFQWSALNDPTAIDALDYATAQGSGDATVRAIADHRELIHLGAKSGEVWYNTGVISSQFARSASGFFEVGCRARHSVVKLDDSVYWLGHDLIWRRLDGRRPVRVQQNGMEELLATFGTTSDAVSWVHTWRGHPIITTTFPTENRTICLDLSTGLWHERRSWNNGLDNRWDVQVGLEIFDKVLVGDYSTADVYELDESNYTENDAILEFLVQTPPIQAQGLRVTMPRLEAMFKTGVGIVGSQPAIMLKWSDDGGQTWKNERIRSPGTVGNYEDRVVWFRNGQFWNRSLQFRITDAIERKLGAVYAVVEADAA